MHGQDDIEIQPLDDASKGREIIDQLPKTALQALYHEITGKTEKLFKMWDRKVVVRQNDLTQLKEKICQQIEIHDAIGPTILVEVSHEDSESQAFSSWDKFLQYDLTRTTPIDEITIKVEFLVKLPKIDKHHRYIIEIGVRSDLAHTPNFFADIPKRLILQLPTARCKIEYVDYLVAKGFLHVVESWFNSLEDSVTSYHFPFLQRHSVHFRFVFLRLGYMASAVFALLSAPWFLNIAPVSLSDVIRWGFTSFMVASVTALVVFVLAEWCEHLVDRTEAISTILINRGDEKRFAEKQNRNKQLTFKALSVFGATLFALGLNVLGTIVIDWWRS